MHVSTHRLLSVGAGGVFRAVLGKVGTRKTLMPMRCTSLARIGEALDAKNDVVSRCLSIESFEKIGG